MQSETATHEPQAIAQDVGMRDNSFLTFVVNEECYAISLDHVIEIVGLQRITQVPNVESYIKGGH